MQRIQGKEKVWKILKNLKKYKFYRKMFQTKVVGFKKSHQFDPGWRRQDQVTLNFLNGTPYFFIAYSYSPSQYLFKAL